MLKLASLYSGSSGNSVYISSQSTHILVDAGLSGKRIEKSMAFVGGSIKNVRAILISHEHMDHIIGAGVLSRRYGIPIYANEKTWEAMRLSLNNIDSDCIRIFSTGQPFKIGDIEVNTFNTPHDAVEPVGFNFFCDRKKVTIATDIGHINRPLLSNLIGSDIILLESNHDVEMLKVGRYPWPLKQRIMSDKGHLCNDVAAKVVAYLAVNGTKKFLLGHLSKENNFPELAFQTVKNALTEKSITAGRDVYVGIAYRDRVSESLVV
ncbi:MAG TPA: MBL fold metallo-hydrolase [Clostridia bacterium]